MRESSCAFTPGLKESVVYPQYSAHILPSVDYNGLRASVDSVEKQVALPTQPRPHYKRTYVLVLPQN